MLPSVNPPGHPSRVANGAVSGMIDLCIILCVLFLFSAVRSGRDLKRAAEVEIRFNI